jgi:PAS domain S-box-containing protein
MHESDEHMEELRKTRDYLDAIVSVSYDGIVVFNEQQQFEYVNDAACRFLGMAREQLIGKHYETVVPPELRKFYQQKWDEMMAVGVEPYEGEIVGHDGSRLSVFISKKVITVGGQKKCVTIVKDISELKATQNALQRSNESLEKLVEERTAELSRTVVERDRVIEALRGSEGKYRELVESCGFIVVTYGCDGRICYVNSMGEQFLGRKAEDIVGMHVVEVIGPEIGGKVAERIKHLVESGEAYDAIDEVETPMGRRWMWGHPSVVRDSNGKPENVTVFLRDITEQKLAETRLEESQERQRIMAEAVFEGIFIHDGGVLIEANKRFYDLFGYTAEELIGKQIMTLVLTEEARKTVEQNIRDGRGHIVRVSAVKKDGTLFSVETAGRDIVYNGRKVRVAVAIDVSERMKAQQKLKESEERYRDVIENSGLVVACFDLQVRFVLINSLGASRLMKKEEDIIGKRPTEVVALPVTEMMEGRIRDVVASGRSMESEDEVVLPAGRRWVRIRLNPILDANGVVTGVILFSQDITERKLAQQKVKESEERYRYLIETAGVSVTCFDEDLRITLVNSVSAARFQKGPDEIVGRRMSDIMASPWCDIIEANIRKVLETGHVSEREIELVFPVGRRWFWSRISPLQGASGKITGAMAFAHDITEQRLAQVALKESESRRRMLTEMSMEGIFMHEGGVLLEANHRYFEMFGYTPEELLGKQARDITLTPESLRIAMENVRTGGNKRIQVTGVRKDGSQFPCEIYGMDAAYKGRHIRVAVAMDVSERVKVEAELSELRERMSITERLAAVGYVGASMAHEINTPLSVMRLTAQMLISDLEKSGKQKANEEQAKTIVNEIDRASEIVRRYREMSRPPRDVENNASDIQAVPERVIQLIKKTADQARLQLLVGSEIPELLVRLGSADSAEQLLFILIENAIQAADRKTLRKLKISGCLKDGIVELRFADNCGGIAQQNLQKIFEPFFSTKPRNVGTGLGLSIVRRLLQERGGQIRVESKVGKGTTFIVTYPA